MPIKEKHGERERQRERNCAYPPASFMLKKSDTLHFYENLMHNRCMRDNCAEKYDL